MQYNILLVDDEPLMLKVLQHYFGRLYSVTTRQDAASALAHLDAAIAPVPLKDTASIKPELPDVIVADLMMPGMDGYEFIRSVRSNRRLQHIPIIMLSGKDSSADRIRCLKAGADDYVVKPFNPEELELRITNLLKRVTYAAV
jgi:DNA-binding response OmpR family regulator